MSLPIRIGAEPEEQADNSEHFTVPGVAAEERIDPATILADVAEDLSQDTETTFTTLAVPLRPDYMVKFNTNIDYDSLRLWIRKARDSKDKADPHMLRLAFAVLSNTNLELHYKGHVVPTSAGGNLTFANPEFQALMKAAIGNSVPAAIRKFYGRDGHIISTMTKVLEEAGYADVDLEDDNSPLRS